MSLVRRYTAYLLFALSSFLKALGKMIITKEKTIVVDSLSLPGWFILDKCIIYQDVLEKKEGKLFRGFTWHTWPMPDLWCRYMDELTERLS